jgi:hypothetical protein
MVNPAYGSGVGVKVGVLVGVGELVGVWVGSSVLVGAGSGVEVATAVGVRITGGVLVGDELAAVSLLQAPSRMALTNIGMRLDSSPDLGVVISVPPQFTRMIFAPLLYGR